MQQKLQQQQINSNVRIRQISGSQQQYYEVQDDRYSSKYPSAAFNQQSKEYLASPSRQKVGINNQESRNTPNKQQQGVSLYTQKQSSSNQKSQLDYNKVQSAQKDNQQNVINRSGNLIDQQRSNGINNQYSYSTQSNNYHSSISTSIPSYSYAKSEINHPSVNIYQSNSSSTASSNKNSLTASNSSQNGSNEYKNVSARIQQDQSTSSNQTSQFSNTQSQLGSKTQSTQNTSSHQNLKKVSNRKCGLYNIGNTCYMNSALQCVFNIPGFLELFIQGKYKNQVNPTNKGVADEFAELVKKIENPQDKYVSERPSGLKKAIERVNQQFYGSGQQDAQELLRTLLEGLHNDLNRIQGKKPYRELEANIKQKSLEKIGEEWFQYYLDRDNSIVTDFFTGQLMSRVTCQVCSTDSIAFDNFMDLSLSFTQSFRILNQHDLDRLLQAFLKEEALDDTYYCKSCKKHTKSKRQLFIWRLPDILVIHLKRFHFGTHRREKLNLNIAFPIQDLDMGKYLERSKGKEQLYDLIGVVNHSGSLYGGHYTAQCKNPHDGTWNEFNDSTCNEINIGSQQYEKGGSSEPYLLFYCRKGFKGVQARK